MPKLTAKKRAALKPSQFGLPDKARTEKARKQPGNYPMPDEGHAISAIRLAKKHLRARSAPTGAAGDGERDLGRAAARLARAVRVFLAVGGDPEVTDFELGHDGQHGAVET